MAHRRFGIKTTLFIVSVGWNAFFSSRFRVLVFSPSSSGCGAACHFLIGYLIYAIRLVHDQVVFSEKCVHCYCLMDYLFV